MPGLDGGDCCCCVGGGGGGGGAAGDEVRKAFRAACSARLGSALKPFVAGGVGGGGAGGGAVRVVAGRGRTGTADDGRRGALIEDEGGGGGAGGTDGVEDGFLDAGGGMGGFLPIGGGGFGFPSPCISGVELVVEGLGRRLFLKDATPAGGGGGGGATAEGGRGGAPPGSLGAAPFGKGGFGGVLLDTARREFVSGSESYTLTPPALFRSFGMPPANMPPSCGADAMPALVGLLG